MESVPRFDPSGRPAGAVDAGASAFHAIINPRSGLRRFDREYVASRVNLKFPGAVIHFTEDRPFDSVLAGVIERNPAGVLIGGGDGTLSAAAGRLADTGIPMGILPMGTFNNFARDLGIPLTFEDALDALAGGRIEKIDAAEANGRLFINNLSIGFYALSVIKRNEFKKRFGLHKLLAMTIAMLAIFYRLPKVQLRLRVEGRDIRIRSPFVFVGNNRYETGSFSLGGRPSLKEGIVSLYYPKRADRWTLVKLTVRSFFGKLRDNRDLKYTLLREAVIGARRAIVTAALDGEIIRMRPPIAIKSRPACLAVLLPERK